MGVKKYKGIRNGRRNMSSLDLGEMRKRRGEKWLLEGVGKRGGGNKEGKLTVGDHGGGEKGE